MTIQYDLQTLRSKLIAMTRLTQRTVDYSIKAMQLGRPELCRVVHNSKDEMSAIRCWIATHGRKLLAAEISAVADSRFVCAALRISGALELACDAAVKIAQQIETRFATEWIPVSAELEEAGQFVNSLLRLCVLSLLKRDVRHAEAVLHQNEAGESLDLAIHLAHQHPRAQTNAQVRFELAITQSLDGIACQTREIADAIILWLEEPSGDKTAHHTARLTTTACTVLLSKPNSPCKAPAFRGAAQAVPTDDFTQARLAGLQQRVCELLVKNQQLRMALIAEQAESRHQQTR